MREGIGAIDQADYRSATRDLPILTTERLDTDPHGMFRLYRRTPSLVAHEAGGKFLLRLAPAPRLWKDPPGPAPLTEFLDEDSVSRIAPFQAFPVGLLSA